MKQENLLDWKPPANARFNGPEYEPARDQVRLTGQIADVFAFMADQRWHTLDAIAGGTSHPHASVSAQLRHLRKKRFGAHRIDRRHIAHGLFEYRFNPAGDDQ